MISTEQSVHLFIWPSYSNTMNDLDKQFLLCLYFQTHLILLTHGEEQLFSLQGKDLANHVVTEMYSYRFICRARVRISTYPENRAGQNTLQCTGLAKQPLQTPQADANLFPGKHTYSPLSVMLSFLKSILCQLSLAFETAIFEPNLK